MGGAVVVDRTCPKVKVGWAPFPCRVEVFWVSFWTILEGFKALFEARDAFFERGHVRGER